MPKLDWNYIAAAERRANMTAHERLLEDVAAGRRSVVDKPVHPGLPDPDYTLGGVPSGWL